MLERSKYQASLLVHLLKFMPAVSLYLRSTLSKTPKLLYPMQSFLREDVEGRARHFPLLLMASMSLHI